MALDPQWAPQVARYLLWASGQAAQAANSLKAANDPNAAAAQSVADTAFQLAQTISPNT